MKKQMIQVASLTFFLFASTSHAADGHSHSHNHGHDIMDTSNHAMHDMGHGSAMFLEKKHINGYDVSFHVMEAQKGMEHGGSHNLMIKVEENGKTLSNVKINSKVIHPNGNEESKGLMKMGDWYMNGYDLGHNGEHQLMILFKTSDGKKHKGGVYYPER